MMFRDWSNFFQIFDALKNLKNQLYGEEKVERKKVETNKGALAELTFENYEELCEKNNKVCMIAFLNGVSTIDYEVENHK